MGGSRRHVQAGDRGGVRVYERLQDEPRRGGLGGELKHFSLLQQKIKTVICLVYIVLLTLIFSLYTFFMLLNIN